MSITLLQVWTTIKRWQVRRKAVHSLLTLDDRMLKDIGISRCDIPTVVDGVLGYREIRQQAAGQMTLAPDDGEKAEHRQSDGSACYQ